MGRQDGEQRLSCRLELQHDVFMGIFGSAFEEPGSPGRDACALQAEQVGLIRSLAWALQEARGQGMKLPIDIFYDDMGAGTGMNGESQLQDESRLAKMMRGLKQMTEQFEDMEVQMHHVKWPPVEGIGGYCGQGQCWYSESSQPHDLIPFEPEAISRRLEVTAVSIRVFSCNAQSIHGKHKYLEEQFGFYDADICMIQETKTKGGFCETVKYMRFESESQGVWGVSIWISKQIHTKSGKVAIARTDVTLIVSEPRIKAVR